MAENQLIQNLKELFALLEKAVLSLQKSYEQCLAIEKENSDLTNLEWEEQNALEALCSRYSRVSDILVKQVFRLVDELALEGSGTMIDLLNRMEKYHVIDSSYDFQEIRELRNKISHEYVEEDLLDIYHKVLKFTPELISGYFNAKKFYQELLLKIS